MVGTYDEYYRAIGSSEEPCLKYALSKGLFERSIVCPGHDDQDLVIKKKNEKKNIAWYYRCNRLKRWYSVERALGSTVRVYHSEMFS